METSVGNEYETTREAKLFASIGKKDVQIEELRRENGALRAQVENLLRQRDGAVRLTANTSEVVPITAGQMTMHAARKPGESEYETLKRTHGELDWRYKSLEALHRGCESKIIALSAKCKHYKSTAWQWKQYIEKKHPKEQTSRPSTSNSEKTARSDHGDSTAITNPQAEVDSTPRPAVKALDPPLGGIRRREQLASDSPAMRSSPLAMQSSIQQVELPQLSDQALGSSQTTVSVEESEQFPLETRTEVPNRRDEEPQLISERCLKRRAPRASARHSPPRRVKRESSSPMGPILLSSDGLRESCDCGDECHCDDLDYVKPRTPQAGLARGSRQRATSEEHLLLVPQLRRSASSLSEGHTRAHVSAPMLASGKVNEQIRKDLLVASTTTISPEVNNDALKTLSVNIPLLPRTMQTPKPKPSGARKSARGKVTALSEDGDDCSQVTPTPKDVEVPTLRKDATLAVLLMGHPSDCIPDAPCHLHEPEHQDRTHTPGQVQTPISLFKAKTPPRRNIARHLPRGVEPPPPSPRPEEEPLRLRDVRTLKLDDFKINPNYLGSEFAFADTLRGRDQRRALHVCTRPDCCGGAMRSVVAMGGQKVSGKTDAQALDDYLGPQYGQIMRNYDAAKRKATVLQAHVHAFTKQHGKHRQAFERQSTPPNFWRTDFATTQENQEDRRKALERDRLDVEARYREAMREDGRWRFRDE